MFRKLLTACVVLSAALPLAAQTGAKNGEWRSYAAEPGSTKYSPLDQVNRDNVKNLRIAWRFKTDNLGSRPDYNMQSTPIVVNGVMYVQAGTRRTVVALDPVSGEMLWMWRMDEGKRGASAPRQGSGRGLAYWTDGKGDERIVTVTPGYHLAQLNAKTGVPVATFGKNGIVDLKTEIDQPGIDLETADIGLNSPPALGNNVIVVGAAHLPGGAPRAKENVKGYIRGYDVRTGKRLWIFHTIPQPGEFGNDTWEKDSWSYTGNAGNWGPITIDEELNRVYLATEDGTGDYFGGHRPGNNLFSATVVCLDLTTGKRLWYFQAIHHDIWDWDFPTAPILMDITVNGKPIKAVAVPSKQAFLYTFDRVSGQPVWPIEERPVPRGKVPTEWYSPTQPYPTKPAAYDMQGIRESDVNDWTPEIKAEALRVLNLHKYSDNLFEPPIDRGQDGKYGMIMMPGNNGGTNWEGGAFDPETKIAYVFSSTEFNRRSLINDPARSNMNYIDGGGGGRGRGAAPAEEGGGPAGGGPGAAAGSPPAGGRGRAGGAGRRCRATTHGVRLAAHQASLRPRDGYQHEHWGSRLDGADWRHTREHQESQDAAGGHHSQVHGPRRPHRHHGDQDPALRRRARSARHGRRSDGFLVPLLRQGHGSHRVGDADSGERHERADHLHGRRQAIHRRRSRGCRETG